MKIARGGDDDGDDDAHVNDSGNGKCARSYMPFGKNQHNLVSSEQKVETRCQVVENLVPVLVASPLLSLSLSLPLSLSLSVSLCLTLILFIHFFICVCVCVLLQRVHYICTRVDRLTQSASYGDNCRKNELKILQHQQQGTGQHTPQTLITS